MSRSFVLALAVLFAGTMLADVATAKPKRKARNWVRYDATLVCDVATTTVVVHNPAKVAISLLVRLTDSVGDTQHTLNMPAESITTFDCTSTALTTTGVLSFEGPVSLFSTATYVGAGGSVDVERIVPVAVRGRRLPYDDSDTGDADSDSAGGSPNPS